MILFGLTNAPASFQGYINKIFTEKLDIFVTMYLDDIFIYIDNDEDSHVIAVRWVLEYLRKFLLYSNLKKSIPSERALVPRLYSVLERHPHRRRKNRDSQAMA